MTVSRTAKLIFEADVLVGVQGAVKIVRLSTSLLGLPAPCRSGGAFVQPLELAFGGQRRLLRDADHRAQVLLFGGQRTRARFRA